MIGDIIIIFSLIISIQAGFSIFLLFYAWEDLKRIKKNKILKNFYDPKLSFSILVPARHEEKVISDTIQQIYDTNYPLWLKEIIVICKSDDPATIQATQNKISEIEGNNIIKDIKKHIIKLVIFENGKANKPNGLNEGLKVSKNDVICVFDAEDSIHPDILNIANTEMIKKKVNIVQSGVQLMNYNSNWFSTFNTLEYFFWFKSALHFFTKLGVVPLAGNTIFIKRYLMEKINGWDSNCLTEDADIGIRLTAMGEKVRVVYGDEYVTKEETPDSIKSLVRQRTRWHQGFLQILKKGDWKKYPKFRQKLFAFYLLSYPFYQAILISYVLISFFMMIFIELPVFVVLISIIPLYLVALQYMIQVVGLYEFTKAHKLKFYWRYVIIMFFTFLPYQWLLGFSSARAVARETKGINNWEKTAHVGAHREKYAIAQFKLKI